MYGLNAYSNSDIDKLDKELITLITIHLNTYYKTILEIANTITANLINENQIIEYLNKHKKDISLPIISKITKEKESMLELELNTTKIYTLPYKDSKEEYKKEYQTNLYIKENEND